MTHYPVSNETNGQKLPDRRRKLVEYADKHQEMPKLLKAIQEYNPMAYGEFSGKLTEQEQRNTINSTNTSNQTNFLAAIVFTDIKDSTQLMTSNRDRTLQAIVRDRQVLESICIKHGGIVVKSLGDGLLMYFTSAESSVTSAIVMQRTLAKLSLDLPPEDILEHRIGIHLSDVVLINGDIMGDGVNFASRIQSCAKPWGICISRVIFDSISAVVKVPIDDGGLRELKGIPYWVRVYHLLPVEQKFTPNALPAKSNVKHLENLWNHDGIVFEEPEGQVPINSSFYVERPPIEIDCNQAILKRGALIRIKAPRQMGKTSLLSRILSHSENHGCKPVTLYFQQADYEVFRELNSFLQWFCASVAEALDLEPELDIYWKGVLGSKDKCDKYFRKYLLSKLDSPLVLGLDEVDLVFQYPNTATDFFALLRAWHEKSKNDVIWQKLRLIIVHSKEVYVPLNINQSPFNVGLPIELPELNRKQVMDLVIRHGLSWDTDYYDRFESLIGGHPYLVRQALYEIGRGRLSFNEFLETSVNQSGIYSDHLRRQLTNLRSDRELTASFKNVIQSGKPIRIETSHAFKLRSMGLVKFEGNDIVPLCSLYERFFSEYL